MSEHPRGLAGPTNGGYGQQFVRRYPDTVTLEISVPAEDWMQVRELDRYRILTEAALLVVSSVARSTDKRGQAADPVGRAIWPQPS